MIIRPVGQCFGIGIGRFVFAFLLSLSCTAFPGTFNPAQATEKPTVNWALTPLPPAMLEQNGQIVGYGVDILNWFASRLPDYTHVKQIVPLPRLMQTITAPGTFCNIGMNPTPERQKFLHFTDAVLPHLPVSLFTSPAREDQILPFVDEQGDVDLERMIAFGKLNGALRSQRSYGIKIDTILRRNANNTAISYIGNDANFLQLIALGRLDWTLYLPAEAEFHRRAQLPDDTFTSWHVAGNDQLMPASIACSKTETGDAIVSAINSLVKENPDMPWTAFYSSSLSEADQVRYGKALENYKTNLQTGLAQLNDQ
ncbi:MULTISPECIES: transporter substrate-binding domain-containing protein [Thalassospira]|uniref:Solute-binding protein family 3/N-terminal domain-containing protein n=2 Tax=Thalassospira TaxID=168934 RepID=A0A367W960_9PROT|nr:MULTISPECIES: transporter substrate-binding domain-containing protein [Thalassospira]MDG4718195.1 hypothetical protein [Thalassospira sp. FZY0004]RCK37953.1 hypothetical protein TH19_08035 [Thalassospira profundimaris]